jgi:hypothetical protein
MIPAVIAQDLCWFLVVLVIRDLAPRRMRVLCNVMLCYIVVETFLHVPMENAVAHAALSLGF